MIEDKKYRTNFLYCIEHEAEGETEAEEYWVAADDIEQAIQIFMEREEQTDSVAINSIKYKGIVCYKL